MKHNTIEKNVDYKKLNLIKKICNINFEKKVKILLLVKLEISYPGAKFKELG